MNQKTFPVSDKILIVEDSRIAQNMLKKAMLGFTNIDFEQARNGAIGLDIIKKSPYVFKAVLLDLSMPVLHGVEFIHRVRTTLTSNKAQTVVIAITGNQNNLSDQEMQDIGLNGAIIKPIDFSKLLQILTNIPSNPPDHWYGVMQN